MSDDIRVGQAALDAAVRITEGISTLPGVATQNLCDQAAATLLPLGRSASAMVMIGHVDEHGRMVQRPEATGVAGVYTAEVTTTVGRTTAAATAVPVDSGDAGLSALRAGVDQARDIGWGPQRPKSWTVRAGTPESFALPGSWRALSLGKRWEAIGPSTLLLAAVGLPGPVAERTLIVEVGILSGAMLPMEAASVLTATLPAMARRLIGAIGESPTSSSDWLTQKEQVVLSHLLMGKSVREIAQELERSQHTVHDHVKSLHRKLKANSRGELVARALGHLAPERPATVTTSERSERVGAE
jgi:DNA-binding CsgD family transcriptional regulator